MVDKNGFPCEYDGYVLPPAPKVVTPEMRQRKKELMIERFVAEVNACKEVEKEQQIAMETEGNKNA